MARSIPRGSRGRPNLSIVDGSVALKDTVQSRTVTPTELDMPPNIAKSKKLRELWQEIVPALMENGLVTSADVPTLALMIRHYQAALEASDELLRDGPTVEGRLEIKKNPAEVVFRSESMSFAAYARELGMTLTSRMRTKLPADVDNIGDNPFA